MRRIHIRVVKPHHVDRVVHHTRATMMHSSAFGFANDFVHAILGNRMVFHHTWELIREPVVSWSALAAAIIVYIDTMREKQHHKEAANDHEV